MVPKAKDITGFHVDPLLPGSCGKVIFSVMPVCQRGGGGGAHCTGPYPWTCSNLFTLDLTLQDLAPPDIFKIFR